MLPAWSTALTAFADSYGEHVYYIGTNQQVYQLYNGGNWVNQPLTGAKGTPADIQCGGKLTGFSSGGDQYVYYVGANGHVLELFWSIQTGEEIFDLTINSHATELALSGGYCSIQ